MVLFSFMKEQVFVPKTPNIFAIIPDHLNSTVEWSEKCLPVILVNVAVDTVEVILTGDVLMAAVVPVAVVTAVVDVDNPASIP